MLEDDGEVESLGDEVGTMDIQILLTWFFEITEDAESFTASRQSDAA